MYPVGKANQRHVGLHLLAIHGTGKSASAQPEEGVFDHARPELPAAAVLGVRPGKAGVLAMTQVPAGSKIAVISAGDATLFDSLARLVPDELQAAYYRVLAHTRTLSPDDEMLRILEAMGTLALLTRYTPKEIAEEREHFQEMFDLHESLSDEAQSKMLGYSRELDSRISALPSGIEASLDPKKIAKLLGESLRQHFLQTGIPATAKGLQTTGEALATTQKELSTTLRNLLDSQDGVVAQIDSANRRLTYSLEN